MILVDAHVHIHQCFDLEPFLDSALVNFKTHAARFEERPHFSAVLLLAETSKQDRFHKLKHCAEDKSSAAGGDKGNWTVLHTDEDNSICMRSKEGHDIFIVAGSQIVTEENIELLALFTTSRFHEHTPLNDLIEDVHICNGIPVIPWGFGKWLGRRGKEVNELLESGSSMGFFLGDNGGRPFFLPEPHQFKLAEEKGIRILPGSDPLPFKSEHHRAGSFGFIMNGTLPTEIPATTLKQMITDAKSHLKTYGRQGTIFRFFATQFAMQIMKNLGRN